MVKNLKKKQMSENGLIICRFFFCFFPSILQLEYLVLSAAITNVLNLQMLLKSLFVKALIVGFVFCMTGRAIKSDGYQKDKRFTKKKIGH